MYFKYFFIYVIVFINCATVKPDPEIGTFIILKSFDGFKNVESIKVWQKPFSQGEKPVFSIKPGIKVKLIDIKGPMALIELEDGKTGWIQKIFLK